MSADSRELTRAGSLQAGADRDYAAAIALAEQLQHAHDRTATLYEQNQQLERALASLSAARAAEGYLTAALMLAAGSDTRDRARAALDYIARDRQLDPEPLLSGFDALRARAEA